MLSRVGLLGRGLSRTQWRGVVTNNYSNDASKTPGREHLLDDSRRGYDHIEKFGQPFDAFHDAKDTRTGRDPNYVHQTIVSERGKKWVVGKDLSKLLGESYPGLHRLLGGRAGTIDAASSAVSGGSSQIGSADNVLPFTPRRKPFVWGNYSLVMKAEFLFFYVPGLLILGLILPVFTMTFAFDESIYTTMTVKVLGRQWYWIYDVESPPEEEE